MKIPSNEQLLVFAAIAEQKSFTRASRLLNIPSTTVGRRLSELEQQLGLKLIHRTTRKMSLSTDGAAFLHRISPLIEELQGLSIFLDESTDVTQGLLRITAPVSYGIYFLQPHLSDFQHKHPEVSLQVFLKNEYTDIVSEGFDLAIRLGPLESSSLVSRKIDEITYKLVATPTFIEKHGPVNKTSKLVKLPCIGLAPDHGPIDWEFSNSKNNWTVRITPALTVNDPIYALHACLNHQGVAYLPSFIIDDHVDSSALNIVLPKCRGHTRDVFAVYHHRNLQPTNLKALLSFLKK